MKDHEIEKAFMDMTASDVPDLWDRIDAATPVSMEEKKMENKEKRSWKTFFFGGGTFRTAIAVCLIIVLGAGVLNGIGGGLRMGSAGKSYSNSYAAAAEAKEYSSDSAYGYASGSSADYDMEGAEEAAFDLSEETPMADAGIVIIKIKGFCPLGQGILHGSHGAADFSRHIPHGGGFRV